MEISEKLRARFGAAKLLLAVDTAETADGWDRCAAGVVILDDRLFATATRARIFLPHLKTSLQQYPERRILSPFEPVAWLYLERFAP